MAHTRVLVHGLRRSIATSRMRLAMSTDFAGEIRLRCSVVNVVVAVRCSDGQVLTSSLRCDEGANAALDTSFPW